MRQGQWWLNEESTCCTRAMAWESHAGITCNPSTEEETGDFQLKLPG